MSEARAMRQVHASIVDKRGGGRFQAFKTPSGVKGNGFAKHVFQPLLRGRYKRVPLFYG
jgi:hypothetical protein